MTNVMDKIIREDDAIATIKFRDGISEEQAQKIDSIISKNYDQKCRYIMKIDRNTYKGDMACLSAFSDDVYNGLHENNLWSFISNFDLYNNRTEEYEDVVEGIDECHKA